MPHKLHLLKNKLGRWLIQTGEQLITSDPPACQAQASPEELSSSSVGPPAHWLAMVREQSPDWIEKSQHPQMLKYREHLNRSQNPETPIENTGLTNRAHNIVAEENFAPAPKPFGFNPFRKIAKFIVRHFPAVNENTESVAQVASQESARPTNNDQNRSIGVPAVATSKGDLQTTKPVRPANAATSNPDPSQLRARSEAEITIQLPSEQKKTSRKSREPATTYASTPTSVTTASINTPRKLPQKPASQWLPVKLAKGLLKQTAPIFIPNHARPKGGGTQSQSVAHTIQPVAKGLPTNTLRMQLAKTNTNRMRTNEHQTVNHSVLRPVPPVLLLRPHIHSDADLSARKTLLTHPDNKSVVFKQPPRAPTVLYSESTAPDWPHLAGEKSFRDDVWPQLPTECTPAPTVEKHVQYNSENLTWNV